MKGGWRWLRGCGNLLPGPSCGLWAKDATARLDSSPLASCSPSGSNVFVGANSQLWEASTRSFIIGCLKGSPGTGPTQGDHLDLLTGSLVHIHCLPQGCPPPESPGSLCKRERCATRKEERCSSRHLQTGSNPAHFQSNQPNEWLLTQNDGASLPFPRLPWLTLPPGQTQLLWK